jgi:hypothetical protein
MPQTEPMQHTKSDGTEGAMSIEIDLDSGAATEPTTAEPTEPTTAAAPATLELGTPAPAPERPTWLDPRFETPEKMAEAYKALEQKLGAPAKPAGEKPADKAPEQTVPIGIGLTDAELAAYGREVVASGKLSEASYAALAAKGIPRALADAHVEGIQLKRAALMSDAVKPFGGHDGYKEAAAWALANLSPAEQAQYNADVNSGDAGRVQYAVNGLKARLDAAQVRQPALVHGRRAGTAQTGGGFQTFEQQVAAQSDPRYNVDPAYTQEVRRMVMESNY